MRLLSMLFAVALGSCAGGTVSSEAPKAGESAGCTPEALNWGPDEVAETVETLAKDFEGAGGIDAWAEAAGRKPRLRIRKYLNKTEENVDLKALASVLQKAMAEGGRIELLAEPGAELNAAHEEQDAGAPLGFEKGADLVGTVELISADEATPTERVRMYTVYVTLTSAEDLSKVWLGEHMVKKMCEMPAAAE